MAHRPAAPPELRFVLATRHDLPLGPHRLRLEGELTEIRTADLRFGLAEARALFGATGVELPAEALARLHERTEGWAAGLRLAALSLAGHPDPERFATHFSGTDRLLSDHWLDLYLGGRGATLAGLLARFPCRVVAASPELTAVQVAGDLVRGSLEDARRHLAMATSALAAVPADRRGRVQVMLAVLRLFLAWRFGAVYSLVADGSWRMGSDNRR